MSKAWEDLNSVPNCPEICKVGADFSVKVATGDGPLWPELLAVGSLVFWNEII